MPAFLTRWWFLILAGAFGALAMPPFYIVPALAVPFTVLFLCLQSAQNRKQAFGHSALIGLGYHLAGLYWIANAMLVPGSPYLWVYPLALVGLPLLFALYFGFVGLIYFRVCRKRDPMVWQRYLLLTILLATMEYVRGFLFTGFPWNLPAYTWLGILPMAQSLALIGPYGLNLLTLAACLLPALFIMKDNTAKRTASVLALIVACVFAGGVWRLSFTNPAHTSTTMLHIVQPNIAQSEKWDAQFYDRHLDRLLSLSKAPPTQAAANKNHVILWPETAVNGRMLTAQSAIQDMKDTLASYGRPAILLAGALRNEENADGTLSYYNSIVVWDQQMQVLDIFDKAHLVPFGEYMPLDQYIPFGPIVGFSGFAAGSGPRTLHVNKAVPAFSPLICYEVIFSGKVTAQNDRPAWLANSTNDSWYGRSTGPYQHLAISQARAIEEGLPLVRSANTGISAVIDAYGRIQGSIPLNAAGVLHIALPAPLPATPYSQHRNLFFFTAIFIMYMFLNRKYGRKQ